MAFSPKKAKTANEEDVPAALLEHAVAWSATNGLGMVVKDDKGLFTSTHLPFSLLPYGEIFGWAFTCFFSFRPTRACRFERTTCGNLIHYSRTLCWISKRPCPRHHSSWMIAG